MIASFANKETEKLFATGKSKKLPSEIIIRAILRLTQLDNAREVSAETVQVACMTFVAGARHNENIGARGTDACDNLVDDARGVDGDDDANGGGETARLQKARIRRVAIKHVVSFAAITRDRGGVRVGDDVGNTVLAQQRAHDFPDAAVPHDDGLPASGCGVGGDFGIHRFARHKPTCDLSSGHQHNSGVNAMVTDATVSTRLTKRASTKPTAAAMPIPTKANSPPGPSSKPVSTATGHDKRKNLPKTISSTAFRAINPTTPPTSKSGSRNTSRKSTFIPTVKKKMPSKRPLNGPTVISMALRYSVSANSKPAMKAPSAMDKRACSAIKPAAMITNNTAATKSSVVRAVATNRNSGRKKETAEYRDDADNRRRRLQQRGSQGRKQRLSGPCRLN